MKVRPVKITQEILALRFKPDDFYHNYKEQGYLLMDIEKLAKASKLAHQLFRNGQSKAGSILICKMADGIREYDHLVSEFLNNSSEKGGDK